MRKKPRSSSRTAQASTWSRSSSLPARSAATRPRSAVNARANSTMSSNFFAPARVVQVLPATAVVAAGGLDVAGRVRADPHVLPGRRDHQIADALQDLGVGHALAVGVEVLEPLAPAAPANAGARAVGSPQSL